MTWMERRERIDLNYRQFECRCGHRIVVCLEARELPRWASCPCGRIIRIELPELEEEENKQMSKLLSDYMKEMEAIFDTVANEFAEDSIHYFFLAVRQKMEQLSWERSRLENEERN